MSEDRTNGSETKEQWLSETNEQGAVVSHQGAKAIRKDQDKPGLHDPQAGVCGPQNYNAGVASGHIALAESTDNQAWSELPAMFRSVCSAQFPSVALQEPDPSGWYSVPHGTKFSDLIWSPQLP